MAKKLNIALLSPYYPPHTGGTERYVKDLAHGLAARGHAVTVITTNVPPSKQEEQIGQVTVRRLPAINLAYLPLATLKPEHVAGFDLIHSHVPPFGFTRTLAAMRLVKVPHVVTYHCDTTVSGHVLGLPVPGWVTRFVEDRTNRYGRNILPQCDAIIATSESYASTSPVLSAQRYHVIPIGIYYERFDQAKEKTGVTEEARRPHQVLFVGRLAANKGIQYLIQTIPKVREKMPDVHYVIAGDGEEKPSLLRKMKQLGVQDAVSFYGKVSIEALTHLYASSTVFVLPSINRLEAFGIVQLEAMACSTPVIASNLPGVNSVIEKEKSGLLVPPGDVSALSEAIVRVLSDFAWSRELGAHARAQIEASYHWRHICAQVEALYDSLLST